MSLDERARDVWAEVSQQVVTIERPSVGSIARRSRRGRMATGLATLAVLALAAGGLAIARHQDPAPTRLEVIHDPEPTPTTVDEPTPTTVEQPFYESLTAELYALLAQVPGWDNIDVNDPALADYDYAFNGPCGGSWATGSTSGHDGGFGYGNAGWNDGRGAGIGGYGYSSEARASSAAASFVENLESCTATAWRTQPIAQTGAVLASSAYAVVWIQHTGRRVEVLQVHTPDGPPPLDIQVGVAEWIATYLTLMDEQTN